MSICSKVREFCCSCRPAWSPLPRDDTPVLPTDAQDVQAIAARANRERTYSRINQVRMAGAIGASVCFASGAPALGAACLALGYVAACAASCMDCRAIFGRRYHAE